MLALDFGLVSVEGGTAAPAFRAYPTAAFGGGAAGAGGGASFSKFSGGGSGRTPYFSQILSYISSSQPTYFSISMGTSASFEGLCFW